jgi:hypothetical protein
VLDNVQVIWTKNEDTDFIGALSYLIGKAKPLVFTEMQTNTMVSTPIQISPCGMGPQRLSIPPKRFVWLNPLWTSVGFLEAFPEGPLTAFVLFQPWQQHNIKPPEWIPLCNQTFLPQIVDKGDMVRTCKETKTYPFEVETIPVPGVLTF